MDNSRGLSCLEHYTMQQQVEASCSVWVTLLLQARFAPSANLQRRFTHVEDTLHVQHWRHFACAAMETLCMCSNNGLSRLKLACNNMQKHVSQYGLCCCREDLRHLPICSVDPPGCRDIDDALHVRELPNGNIELGVHIADVTNFLMPATAMDDEASVR